MNQKTETTPQPNDQGQRAEIERELKLTQEYWLRTIYAHIKGRVLRGVEFFVAQDAHLRLRAAIKNADEWNGRCVAAAGKPFPPPTLVSVDVNLAAENFREPRQPEMLFADNVKPDVLAMIAAPLVKKGEKPLTPDEAANRAHELLMAAERYIGTLPEKKEGVESLVNDLGLAFSYVTFEEIHQSNKKASGQLPLLPPLQTKRKGRGEKEIRDEPLSMGQIRAEVRKFLQNQIPQITQVEYDQMEQQTEALAIKGQLFRYGQPTDYREWQQHIQADVDDCMKNNRVAVQSLCRLRWERFKQFVQKQQGRAVTREANKTSAANPRPAGKRK